MQAIISKKSLYILFAFAITLSNLAPINTKASEHLVSSHFKGCAYNDYNLNGSFDINENGMNNLLITIYKPNTTEVVTTSETDIEGKFFVSLTPGTYDIVFDIPSGFEQVNTSSFFNNIKDGKIKGVVFVEQLSEDQAININVTYLESTNPRHMFNKQFNKDFNQKFNDDFNTAFNAKFNEDYNKFFNIGYFAALNKITETKPQY